MMLELSWREVCIDMAVNSSLEHEVIVQVDLG